MTPTADSLQGFRNRIINGDMRIDQRNAGATISTTGYPVDRFGLVEQTSATFTAGQSTTAPAGFTNSFLLTIGTGASATSTQYAILNQKIEGYNSSDFGFGTADAKNATLSFWVRSSVSGIYCASLKNTNGSRTYIKEYTISAADTWEYKIITFPGDTSGTWGTGNGVGLSVYFDFGSGSGTPTGTADSWITTNATRTSNQTDFVNNSGATWYITGAQLEVGSVATPFERRPYGTELSLCQRYALKYNTDAIVYAFIGAGYATSTTNANISLPLPVQMRTAPTATASNLMVQDGTTITAVTATAVVTNQTNSLNAFVQATVASGLTAFRPYQLQTNNNTAGYLLLSAEL
jgi:hypothetical protein